MSTQQEDLRSWIGRWESVADAIYPTPFVALSATLDHPTAPVPPARPLPPLWHWLYFLPLHRQSEIGPDGHAQRGGFLPPVPLPRRMWAGSQFEFHKPLLIGDRVDADIDHRRRHREERTDRPARLREGSTRDPTQ